MIKLSNTVTPNTSAMSSVIRGMRNPMNSWDKSDSFDGDLKLGENDAKLMKSLSRSGASHAKYRRMMVVYVDILAPLYWWKEFDTYKVGTVANSCSTMHKIASKPFVKGDFSNEHLTPESRQLLGVIVDQLNAAREEYLEDHEEGAWWQMIQLLPSSYNQKRTVMLNYEVLANMYYDRRNHKLHEWRTFCRWIEKLPYFDTVIKEDYHG